MAIDFSKYGTPITQQKSNTVGQQPLQANTPKVTKLPEKEEKFWGMTGEEFIKQPKYKQYAQAFIATLPKDAADFFSGVLKLGKGAVEATATLPQVGKVFTGEKVNVPDLGGYVSQASKALEGGAKPFGWEAMIKPAGETILSGAEAYGMAKLVSAYGKMRLANKALNQTSSALTKSEKVTAGERIVKGSEAFGVKKVPTSYEKQVAKVAEPYISNNIVKTENNLKNGIEKIAVNLSNNIDSKSTNLTWKVKKALLDEIDSINPSILTKADPVKNTAFNEFKNRIMTMIGTAKNDSELFEIRKGIDKLVTEETQGKIWEMSGRLNPIYEMWRNGRKTINNLISQRIPGTSESLKTQSLLYDALDGVAEKVGILVNKPGTVQKVLKSGLRWGTGLATGAAGGYVVSKAISGR
jgi:hypothetical protein